MDSSRGSCWSPHFCACCACGVDPRARCEHEIPIKVKHDDFAGIAIVENACGPMQAIPSEEVHDDDPKLVCASDHDVQPDQVEHGSSAAFVNSVFEEGGHHDKPSDRNESGLIDSHGEAAEARDTHERAFEAVDVADPAGCPEPVCGSAEGCTTARGSIGFSKLSPPAGRSTVRRSEGLSKSSPLVARWVWPVLALLGIGAGALAAVGEHYIAGILAALVPAACELGSNAMSPPSRFWRCGVAVLIALSTVALVSFQVYNEHRLREIRERHPNRYSILSCFKNDIRLTRHLLSLSMSAVPAIACCLVRHPPSRSARSTVQCVLVCFFLSVSYTNLGCLGTDQEFANNLNIFLVGVQDILTPTSVIWIWALVLCRIRALESSSGLQNVAILLRRLLVVAGFSGTAAIILMTLGFRNISSAGFIFTDVIIVAMIGVSLRAFLPPMAALYREWLCTSGIPAFEARWAFVTLVVEAVSVVVSASTTIIHVLCFVNHQLYPSHSSSVAYDLTLALDQVGNACALPFITGLFQIPRHKSSPWQRPKHGQIPHPELHSDKCAAWTEKVEELAHRGVRLESLLDFYGSLFDGTTIMTSFDPTKSTTNDVVRQAVIPMSRHDDDSGGVALATKMNSGEPLLAQHMVTHCWCNSFTNLVAAVVAHALGKGQYELIAVRLVNGQLDLVKSELQESGSSNDVYWICAISVNQHTGICGGFGPEPTDPLMFKQWDAKRRNTVTGDVHPTCMCRQRKFFNDEPNDCEMNKFDDMMRYLKLVQPGFEQVIAMDASFRLFDRAWCLAEVVEADNSQIQQRLILRSSDAIDAYYSQLKAIDVRKAEASRAEDKEEILSKIPDIDFFNGLLQWLVFSESGLLKVWMDAEARLHGVGRVVARAMARRSSSLSWRAGIDSKARADRSHGHATEGHP